MAPIRALVHISRGEQRVPDPGDVYCLRARGGETEIRLHSRTPLVDVRPMGEVAPYFEPFGIARIHREHAANIATVKAERSTSNSAQSVVGGTVATTIHAPPEPDLHRADRSVVTGWAQSLGGRRRSTRRPSQTSTVPTDA